MKRSQSGRKIFSINLSFPKYGHFDALGFPEFEHHGVVFGRLVRVNPTATRRQRLGAGMINLDNVRKL